MENGAGEAGQIRPHRSAAGRVLKGILVLQVVLALGLLASDFTARAPDAGPMLPFALPGERAPGLDAPVAPGDQRRRFVPRALPNLPAAGDMPSRLLFAFEGPSLDLTGQIATGDGARLAEALASRAAALSDVTIHSVGGSVADALEIGRMLRAAGAAVTIPAGRLCLSACPYMLAGGVERTVGPGAAVGVHQHYHGENSYLPAFLAVEDIQRGQADVMAYLAEMGIDPLVMVPALSTPPGEIYVLLPEELERYRMVTGGDG